MVCYLDFEANGISQAQEIISIGAVAETGETFNSLVRPHAKLDHNIKVLTGISQEAAEVAPTIEEVMENFFNWLDSLDETVLTFYVFGHCDRKFVSTSIGLTDDPTTKARLTQIKDHLEDTSKRVARKFNRDTIGLRSAYLTMRLSSNEPVEQRHDALEDAEMLKWVWENLKDYEMPEGLNPVKVPRFNLSYGKKKQKKPISGCKKTRRKKAIRQCPELLDKKYEIGFTAQKGQRKPIHFSNVRAATTLINVGSTFRDGQQKLELVETLYNAIQTGGKVKGWVFTKDN